MHGCVAVEQVCYNLVGSYVCINADGSFSAPGPTPPQGSFPGTLSSELRPPGFEISNEIAQGRSHFISGSGALGVQGFPGAERELGLPALSHSQGRCPQGYSFNLERQACDGELLQDVSFVSYLCAHEIMFSLCKMFIFFIVLNSSLSGNRKFLIILVKTSTDVDECEVTSGLCGRRSICQNTIGSYTCTHVAVADCPPGFAFDFNLQSCLGVFLRGYFVLFVLYYITFHE